MSEAHEISDPPGLKVVLEGYLRENQEVFLKHAGSKAMPESLAGIHQMRVAAKRLRSLYRLMAWLAPDRFNPRIELKAVRKFFKAAGEVRDLQMRQQLMDKECEKLGLDFPRYAALLRSERVKAQKRLRKKMPHFSAEMLTRPNAYLLSLLEHMPEEEVRASAAQLVRQRDEEMHLLVPPKYDAERLHKIRILLKENLYVMTQMNAAFNPPAWDPTRVEQVKKAGEIAGDWHDLEVLVEALDQLAVSNPRLFPNPHHFELLKSTLQEEMKHDLRRYKRQLKRVLGEPDGHLHVEG